jgi:predicted Zn-dependent protease
MRDIQFPPGVFSDVRMERTVRTYIQIRDGQLVEALDRVVAGAFLRVLKDGNFYASSTTNIDSLSDELKTLAGFTPITKGNLADPAQQMKPLKTNILIFEDRRIDAVSMKEKIDLLKSRIHLMQRNSIKTWLALHLDTYCRKEYYSSAGAECHSDFQSVGFRYHFSMAHRDELFSESFIYASDTFEDIHGHEETFDQRIEESEEFLRYA